MEYGESIIKAAIRETKEEAGVDIKIVGILGIENYIIDDSHYLKFLFMGEILLEEFHVDGKEIIAVQWFSLEEIEKMKDQLRKPDTMELIINSLPKNEIYSLDILRDYL